MGEFLKSLVEKLDNDTLIIAGMIGLAIYGLSNSDGGQLAQNVVSILGGYIGGQYVATKQGGAQ